MTVDLAVGDDVTCVFTNVPETTPTYSIVVDKVNNANGQAGYSDSEQAPAAGTSVPFQFTITNDGTALVTTESVTDTWPGQAEELAVLSLADLDCDVTGGAADVELDGLELDPAESVVCTFTLAGYVPPASGSRINTLSVTTEEDADDQDDSTVTTPGGQIIIPVCVDDPSVPGDQCSPEPPEVITDVCPDVPGRQRLVESCVEVLPDEVTPPTAPPTSTPPLTTPPPSTPPEVRGDVVTRTLPRTGSESRDLAASGAALLLLGAGLVITSRLRLRTD